MQSLVCDVSFASHLFSIEANDFVVLHRLLLFFSLRLYIHELFHVLLHELLILRRDKLCAVGILLDKTNHCPVTLRHELLVERFFIFEF